MDKTIKGHVVKLASSNHSPYDTRIFEKEAKSLKLFGFDVVIIIPYEHDEEKEGIRIVSVKKPASGWEKLFITPFRIFFRAAKMRGVNCFHLHDAELLITGILLKILGFKVIYDAHEDTPEQIKYQFWIPKILKPLFVFWYRFLEWTAGKTFDCIISATPGIAQNFPENKTFLVRNFPIVNRMPDLKLWNERSDQMVYIGSITATRSIKEMIDAFMKTSVDIDFMLGGKFSPAHLKDEITRVEKVKYLDWLSLSDVYHVLSDSKLGLIMPHPIGIYLTNYPVKLFEYMLAGLPVIVTEGSLAAKFVEEADCGFAVNPFDADQVSKAINTVFADSKKASEMGMRGRQLIIEKYNWELECLSLKKAYERLHS